MSTKFTLLARRPRIENNHVDSRPATKVDYEVLLENQLLINVLTLSLQPETMFKCKLYGKVLG